jgi:putative DNA primase/helicase
LIQEAFSDAGRVVPSGSPDDQCSEEPTPWPDEVDGADLLDGIVGVFKRYLALPDGSAEAFALWTLHTYTIDAASVSPFLALNSPEKRCGKTSALTLLDALVKKPLTASNITPAALFRSVEEWRPTLLIDEADTFIRKSDDLRGILNSGHTRSAAYVIRVVGDDHTPKRFSTWCAKAIALIGRLPSTLEDRAIVIPMKRRAPDERVERLRQDRVRDDLEPLRRKAARWANEHLERLRDLDPEMPAELHDRAQDNWRPLFAIAEAAGGSWPGRIVQVSRALLLGEEDETPRIQLLADLRDLFESSDQDRLSSDRIAGHLGTLDDRPWAAWNRGQPLTKSQLAKLLKNFGIRPKAIRIGDRTPRGYDLSQFDDAFRRYLPTDPQRPQQAGNHGQIPDSGHCNTAPAVAPGKGAQSAEESTTLRVLHPREWKNAS